MLQFLIFIVHFMCLMELPIPTSLVDRSLFDPISHGNEGLFDDDDFCYKCVQTPGMSPPRAGAWAYCLFTP